MTLNIHINPKLQHSWNKHGEDKFVFTIVEAVEPDQQKLFDREQYYLDTLKPYVREVGYNISPQADGGDNITHNPNREAFVEKMKIINHGENNGMFGKTHSEESIQKQKEKAKGRFTLEWFIERYGKRDGKKKYNARRLMLATRKCNISRIAWNKGKSISWKHKDGWLERRKQTEEYFSSHMSEFKQMVVSGKYSNRELSKILNIPRCTIERNIKRINIEPS